MSNQSYFF